MTNKTRPPTPDASLSDIDDNRTTRIIGTEWDRAACAAEAAQRAGAGELSEPDNHSLDFALWTLALLKENDFLRAERTSPPATGHTAADNRVRLIALVAAGTKLDAARRMIREAAIDVARSGLMPKGDMQKIANALDAYLQRINFTITLIP